MVMLCGKLPTGAVRSSRPITKQKLGRLANQSRAGSQRGGIYSLGLIHPSNRLRIIKKSGDVQCILLEN